MFEVKIPEINLDSEKDQNNTEKPNPKKSRALELKTKHIFRRAFSEVSLMDILPHDLREGYSYHCISNGDIDSFSYLKFILRRQSLEYLLFSTWCMATEDIIELQKWIEKGKIKRFDCYVGEIFKGSYNKQYDDIIKLAQEVNGRVAIFRNHSKVFVGLGEKFDFAIESSANINTNPRCENTTMTISSELAYFYKDFFDDIIPFNKEFQDWKKYKRT